MLLLENMFIIADSNVIFADSRTWIYRLRAKFQTIFLYVIKAVTKWSTKFLVYIYIVIQRRTFPHIHIPSGKCPKIPINSEHLAILDLLSSLVGWFYGFWCGLNCWLAFYLFQYRMTKNFREDIWGEWNEWTNGWINEWMNEWTNWYGRDGSLNEPFYFMQIPTVPLEQRINNKLT